MHLSKPIELHNRKSKLESIQIKNKKIGCQKIPGWNARCDKPIELYSKFMKPPYNERNEKRMLG